MSSLGLVLPDIAKTLKVGQISAFELRTEGHFMALSIQCKRVSKKRTQYILKCYDPNRTDTHKRVICSNLEELKALEFTDVLEEEYVRLYFAKFKIFSLLAKAQCSERVEHRIAIYDGIEDSRELYFLLRYGLVKTLKNRLQSLGEKDNLDLSYMRHLLTAKDSNGNTGLFFTLGYRRFVIWLDVCEFILSSPLSGSDKHLLLQELNYTDVLNKLIYDKATYYLEQFILLVLDSNLSNQVKIKLLLNKISNPYGGLYQALLQGNFNFAGMYMKLILSAKFSPLKKQLLLTMSPLNGKTGLFRLLCNGKTDAVSFYSKTILESNLLDASKFLLLLAKDTDKYTGFYMACFSNRQEAVNFFASHILASSLSEELKVQLLEACVKGATAFYQAFSHGHEVIAHNLTALVIDSNLTNSNKVRLLSATDAFGMTGVEAAARAPFTAVTCDFKRQVLASDLTSCEKEQLIKPLLKFNASIGYKP